MSPTPPPASVRRDEFQTIFRQGESWKGKWVELWVLGQKQHPTRWGIVVSRKAFRRAVDRNRLKRQIRESLRQIRQKIRPGHLAVVRVKTGQAMPGFQNLQEEVTELCRKAKIF